MSKLDQIKALGDAKRAARNSSDGRRSVLRPVKSSAEKAAKPFVPGVETEKGAVSKPAAAQRQAQGLGAGLTPRLSEAKRGRGRPKVEGPRPWETAGVSKTTYYRERRRAEQKGTQK